MNVDKLGTGKPISTMALQLNVYLHLYYGAAARHVICETSLAQNACLLPREVDGKREALISNGPLSEN